MGYQSIDFFCSKEMKENGLKPSWSKIIMKLSKRASLDLTGSLLAPDLLARFWWFQRRFEITKKFTWWAFSRAFFWEKLGDSGMDVSKIFRQAMAIRMQISGLQWPYRDWVIQHSSESFPYDQFITWHLPGTFYPNATQGANIATRFSTRNHKYTEEGEWSMRNIELIVLDKKNTISKGLLGINYGMWHSAMNHKYDPFSQTRIIISFLPFSKQCPRERLWRRWSVSPSLPKTPILWVDQEDLRRGDEFYQSSRHYHKLSVSVKWMSWKVMKSRNIFLGPRSLWFQRCYSSKSPDTEINSFLSRYLEKNALGLSQVDYKKE